MWRRLASLHGAFASGYSTGSGVQGAAATEISHFSMGSNDSLEVNSVKARVLLTPDHFNRGLQRICGRLRTQWEGGWSWISQRGCLPVL